MIDFIDLSVGARIWFAEETRPYRVRARSDRFLVCTKPYNVKHTVLYTIIDCVENIRGAENMVLGLGQETDEQCEATLQRLMAGESAVSHRNRIPLRISRMVAA